MENSGTDKRIWRKLREIFWKRWVQFFAFLIWLFNNSNASLDKASSGSKGCLNIKQYLVSKVELEMLLVLAYHYFISLLYYFFIIYNSWVFPEGILLGVWFINEDGDDDGECNVYILDWCYVTGLHFTNHGVNLVLELLWPVMSPVQYLFLIFRTVGPTELSMSNSYYG